jgi:hypothetical protein
MGLIYVNYPSPQSEETSTTVRMSITRNSIIYKATKNDTFILMDFLHSLFDYMKSK